MQEIVIEKKASISLGIFFLILSLYCIQYSILEDNFILFKFYYICLFSLMSLLALSFYCGIRFTGFDLVPPRALVVVLFWMIFGAIVFLYVFGHSMDSLRKARIVHLIVGLYLYSFSASAIFGSFFSGLGFRLFLNSPFTWLKYLLMRQKGEL